MKRAVPDFSSVADNLGQIGREERIFVIEVLHRRLVTAKDIKRLDSYILGEI
jgi:hypothetical protein